MDYNKIRNGIKQILMDKGLRNVTPKKYQEFVYPKVFPLMQFQTQLYQMKEFGHLLFLQTTTKWGMNLLTCSFTPSYGLNIPYLLIDCMETSKKATVFTEFYDCTVTHKTPKPLVEVYHQHAGLADYQEKEGWYTPLREDYSLIKAVYDELSMIEVIFDTVTAYGEVMNSAETDLSNLEKLSSFRHRMIVEGNPATGILKKALGKDDMVEFYRTCIMPIASQGYSGLQIESGDE